MPPAVDYHFLITLYGNPSGGCVLHNLMGVSPPVLTRRLFVKKYHYPQTCHRHIRSNPIFTALDSRKCVHAERLISLINVTDDLTIQFSKFREVFSSVERSPHLLRNYPPYFGAYANCTNYIFVKSDEKKPLNNPSELLKGNKTILLVF